MLATRLQVQQLVATKLGWEPVEKLLRLEGFKEVWERTLFRGRELQPEQTLESAKLPAGATIAAVRKVLVAEGWKVRRFHSSSIGMQQALLDLLAMPAGTHH